MKNRLPLLLTLSLLAAGLQAQTPAAQGPMPRKVAVIDFDRAVLANAEGLKARNQLDARLKSWQQKSDAEVDNQKKLKEKQSQAGLSETEKTSIAKQIKDIDIALARMKEDAAKDLDARKLEFFGPVTERVKNMVKTYGEEQNLAAVFNDTSVEGPVLFKSDVVDITSEIIRRVNTDIEKNPAKPAPGIAAAPTGGAAAPKKN